MHLRLEEMTLSHQSRFWSKMSTSLQVFILLINGTSNLGRRGVLLGQAVLEGPIDLTEKYKIINAFVSIFDHFSHQFSTSYILVDLPQNPYRGLTVAPHEQKSKIGPPIIFLNVVPRPYAAVLCTGMERRNSISPSPVA